MRWTAIFTMLAMICASLAQETPPATITGYTGMAKAEYNTWAEAAHLENEERTAFLAIYAKKLEALEQFDAKYATKAAELRQTYATAVDPQEKAQAGKTLKALLYARAKLAASHDKQAMSMLPKEVLIEMEATTLWDEARTTYYPAYKLDDEQVALAMKICRQYARIKVHNASAQAEKKKRLAKDIRDRVLTPAQRDHFNRVGPPKKEKPPEAVEEEAGPGGEAATPEAAPAAPPATPAGAPDDLFDEAVPAAPPPAAKPKKTDLFGD